MLQCLRNVLLKGFERFWIHALLQNSECPSQMKGDDSSCAWGLKFHLWFWLLDIVGLFLCFVSSFLEERQMDAYMRTPFIFFQEPVWTCTSLFHASYRSNMMGEPLIMLLGTLGGESVLQPFLFHICSISFIFISFVPSIRSGQCREGLWQRLRSTAGAHGALSPDGCRTECGDDMSRKCLPVPFVDFLTVRYPSFLFFFQCLTENLHSTQTHVNWCFYAAFLLLYMFACLNFALVNKCGFLTEAACWAWLPGWQAFCRCEKLLFATLGRIQRGY